MPNLIALDIDGTLTSLNGQVNQHALAATRQAQQQGAHVVLISARPPQGVARIADILDTDVYRVSYFGALIQDEQGSEQQRLRLDIAIARDIARFADSHGYSVTITLDDTEYHTQHQQRPATTPVISAGSAVSVLEACTPPVLISFEGHQEAAAFDAYCTRHYAEAVAMYRHFTPDGAYISTLVVHPNAQKGRALATVCRMLHVDPRDAIAIGDSESDITMFQVAGTSVAVANATPDVRTAATTVAPFENGEGVVWALRQIG
jgi:hypothetical protein